MESLANITARLARCEAQIANLQQYAKVIAVHENDNLVDVEARGVQLTGIPYQTGRAGTEGKTFWMPEVGEVGLLMSPGGDIGNAVLFPSINYGDNPAPRDDKDIMLRQFDAEAWEEYNGDDDAHTLRISGDTEIKIERQPGKVEAKAGNAKITLLESNKTRIELTPQIYQELTAIVLNAVGAHFFPTGVTSLQTAVGTVFFPPAASPGAAPSPPAGTPKNADGEVTGTPPQDINGVTVRVTSALNLPAIPVATTGGSGTTTPGRYLVTGELQLTFPSRSF